MFCNMDICQQGHFPNWTIGHFTIWRFVKTDICQHRFANKDVYQHGHLPTGTFANLNNWTFGNIEICNVNMEKLTNEQVGKCQSWQMSVGKCPWWQEGAHVSSRCHISTQCTSATHRTDREEICMHIPINYFFSFFTHRYTIPPPKSGNILVFWNKKFFSSTSSVWKW